MTRFGFPFSFTIISDSLWAGDPGLLIDSSSSPGTLGFGQGIGWPVSVEQPFLFLFFFLALTSSLPLYSESQIVVILDKIFRACENISRNLKKICLALEK
jgi:hypothetical protein